MNARRSIRGRWCSMAVLIAVAAAMLVASIAPALAATGAGNALDFDGTDDYVDCGDINAIDGISKLTVEAWVNWRTLDRLSTIVSKRNNHWDKIQFGLGASGNTNDVRIQIGADSLGYGYTTGDIISTDTWYHVAMVFDGSKTDNANRLKLYLDGVQQPLTYSGTLPSTTCTNSAVVTVGAETYTAGVTNVDGQVDEVRIWNTARTEAQICENMNKKLTGSESGLVIYYRFDESFGTLLPDLTPNNNNGALQNMDDGDWVTSYAAVGDKSHFGTGTSNLIENADVPVDITWDGDTPGATAIFAAIQNDVAPDVTAGILAQYPPTYWELAIANNDGFKADVTFHYDGISGLGGKESTFLLYTRSNAGESWSEVADITRNNEGSDTDGIGSITANDLTGFSQFIITYSDIAPPTLNCTCGDICVNETGWWRDGGVFSANTTAPIQAAVDAAAAGETICVAAGSYSENVDVDKQVTLAGEGADEVTVTAVNSGDPVFDVAADYVNISGFEVTGAWDDAGIYLDGGQHCNISDNTASNNDYGIYLYDSSNNTLTNNNASDNDLGIRLDDSSNYNTLTGNTASGNEVGIVLGYSSNNTLTCNTASGNGVGIWLDDSSNDNTLTGNNASGNWAGIWLGAGMEMAEEVGNNTTSDNFGRRLPVSSKDTLANNDASDKGYGIGLDVGVGLADGVGNNTLTSNTASDNCVGIALEDSSNNTLTSNTASGNEIGILMVYSSNNTFTSNTASDNYYGIGLGYSSNNTLTSNTASDNSDWDICIDDSPSSTFTDNTLNGTTVSFTYSGDVSLKGVGSPAADPSGQHSIGKFINATNQSAGARLYLNFSYSGADVSGLDESGLAVWKYNGTEWLGDGWNGTRYLSTANNVVGVDITNFSVFAPMAPAAAGSTGGGGSGGSGTYPPGWLGTPTPTVTATKAPAASANATATDAPPGERVTPVATKTKPAAAKATTPAAAETAKKDAPGFPAVFVIAGILAVAYAMMRRRG